MTCISALLICEAAQTLEQVGKKTYLADSMNDIKDIAYTVVIILFLSISSFDSFVSFWVSFVNWFTTAPKPKSKGNSLYMFR
jgi:hypothetical protein